MDITMRARIIIGLRALRETYNKNSDEWDLIDGLVELFLSPPQASFNELGDVIKEINKAEYTDG